MTVKFTNRCRPPTPLNLLDLIEPKKCYALIRCIRWGETVTCPKCGSHHVIKRGFDDTQANRQRYQCKGCSARFDDLTDTIFAGHHQPLGVWILCLYLMGLNLSNHQISNELDLNKDDTQQMTSQLRKAHCGTETRNDFRERSRAR